MNELYALAPPNSTLIAPGPDLPWQSKRYVEIDYQLISHRLHTPGDRALTEPELASAVGRELQNEGNPASFVVITRSLRVYDRLFGAAKWGGVEALERGLSASPRFRSVIDEPDAHVFEYLPTVRRNG